MNAWLADGSNLPGHENGAFHPSTIDPSAAFLHPSPTPQDPNQFQQQRMFSNGVSRNVSPGFHNPNQVIPSKRPRPEDGMSMSPRPASGSLSASRSQTPQQVPFPGYQAPNSGAPQFPAHPTPYQHLQQGAPSNVTQSPIMQEFDQTAAQRMGTASPSPFSPAGHMGPQMSPSQSDHSNRVNTPQGAANFMSAGQPFPQGVGSQFSPPTAMTSGAVQAPMPAQFSGVPQGYQQALAAQQQRLYAMQMQNQARPMNAAGNPALAGRPGSSGINPMANPQQMAALRQSMAKPTNPEGFMRSLQKFMITRNLPLDPSPVVSGRHISLVQLYATVIKLGGSKKVTASQMWPAIAQQLQFPPMQFPMAVQEIRDHYQRNLAPYEQALLSSQHKPFTDQMQQGAIPRQPSDPSGLQFQSPTVKPGAGFEPAQQLAHSPTANAALSNNMPHVGPNGFATPTPVKGQNSSNNHNNNINNNRQPQHQSRPSVSRHSQPPTPQQDSPGLVSGPSPAHPVKPEPVSMPGKPPGEADQHWDEPLKHPIGDTFKPMVLHASDVYGPIALEDLYQMGEDISRWRPNVPTFVELGVIDIHALTMSIKSGIHAEMRMALDTLTTISSEPTVQISLDNCEDLVESLVECAEDQAELLAENSVEVSDELLLPTYEEVTRGCQTEFTSLADVPEFGSVEYELDRAADRLICITTILRNFSFTESNFNILGIPAVIKFLATIVRYLGTRNMFMRTHQNTLDFMKDAVICLSNIGHTIHLPGKEETLCLVHFLLSFAPSPAPIVAPEGIYFATYNSSIHKYTPAAVDCLAKLLARDDPNRTYFQALFAGDGVPSLQQDLLTRAFGLAICSIPDQPRKSVGIPDSRKVFLMQGLLAADVLTTFADGSLSRAWLGSVDGFAIHLLRLSCLLGTERVLPMNQRSTSAARGQMEADAYTYGSIIHRGLAILRRLAEKSKNMDSASSMGIPSGVIPRKESLLGTLLMPNVDPIIIRQLLTYARIGD
ncbi:hypothetical protein ASPZODRAFT_148841 [Penicilliopsis zonata CBS 506.65]|uniref:ARID domain-containing protein n=1 Tax=Penicilliopsis zonata CBS 506.65 TaxID=1073090 RepID=A0A1L9SWK0_9EURO|nr:hypothetical protein ASPZODRAFT_148841 [Penicilliopsis zonata CBS 506.65]OJJ51582.1 hypothetical protein ASPZODRAFT_148841 [Penicilliopsis zonata CBS 506.65]